MVTLAGSLMIILSSGWVELSINQLSKVGTCSWWGATTFAVVSGELFGSIWIHFIPVWSTPSRTIQIHLDLLYSCFIFITSLHNPVQDCPMLSCSFSNFLFYCSITYVIWPLDKWSYMPVAYIALAIGQRGSLEFSLWIPLHQVCPSGVHRTKHFDI